MAQISTVLVPALVIQQNNTILGREGNTIYGQILNIPCRNDFIDDTSNYWFVPAKDEGAFTTIVPVPARGDYEITPPTFDSIQGFRVRDKISRHDWWAYGTWQDFIASCGTCCGDAAIPMPGTDGNFIWQIAPCSQICEPINEDGDFVSYWGLPTLGVGQTYFPYGGYNNTELPAASASGYPDVTSLLTFLNANWTQLVWTASVDNLTLIGTGGDLNDVACVSVIAIEPSA